MGGLREVRNGSRIRNRLLLEPRDICHLKRGPHSDGCGYFAGKYCYLSIDCRRVRGETLCWVSVIDHYSGEVLLSQPCDTTPEAARYGRDFFTTPARRRK